ncbi:hypothetical protein TWF694_004466 [Orbilia ellipsospora]|uniref:Extracellular membrane protein CFEM domain-containing protein n=1 Tax=Orbilia ellipsospora TaxID=2528407 RepID=A0AAV9WXS2_9PEZI
MSTMRSRSLFAVSILAASVAAQSSGSLPPSCNLVANELKSCVPTDATNAEITGPEITSCICSGNDFDSYVSECLQEGASTFTDQYKSALEEFVGFCATYYTGGSSGGGSGSSRTPTTPEPSATPSGDSGSTGNTDCDYALAGLSTCWTDNNSLPTAAPVANCLCSGTDFDVAIDACYSALVADDSTDAPKAGVFTDFCSSYSAGAFGSGGSPETSGTRTGGSGSQTTGGFLDSGPPNSSAASSPSRVIQTLSPGTTSDSASAGGSSSTPSTSSSSNGGGTSPNGAGTLEITILGTAFAAFIAGAAMFL